MLQGFKKWKELFLTPTTESEEPQQGKKGQLNGLQWILILAGIGIAIMIFHNYFSIQEEMRAANDEKNVIEVKEYTEVLGSDKRNPSSMQEYEEYLENQLKEILSKIQGVGEVSVMLNIDSTEEVIYERNSNTKDSKTEETDREGGNRYIEDRTRDQQVVLIRQGNDEEPLVIKTKKPAVRGVLVVASGAENMQVKTWVIEAVQRVLDVPAHRVSVMPRK